METTTPADQNGDPGEARRHFRSAHKLRWRVDVAPADPGLGAERKRARAETLGVSLGGAFILGDAPAPRDSELHLWLYPTPAIAGGPTFLQLLAQIRWISREPGDHPPGYGVAFRALRPADEIALHLCFSRSAKVV